MAESVEFSRPGTCNLVMLILIAKAGAAPSITQAVLVAQLRHLLCIRSGGTCAWFLWERTLTWIHQWHVSCAIYLAAIWGGSPCASGVAPSMAVASITKLHTPRSRKLHRFSHVRRILNMYSRFCVGKRWLRYARYINASCAMYVGPPGGQSTWRN